MFRSQAMRNSNGHSEYLKFYKDIVEGKEGGMRHIQGIRFPLAVYDRIRIDGSEK